MKLSHVLSIAILSVTCDAFAPSSSIATISQANAKFSNIESTPLLMSDEDVSTRDLSLKIMNGVLDYSMIQITCDNS